jgi:hypothetical protein
MKRMTMTMTIDMILITKIIHTVTRFQVVILENAGIEKMHRTIQDYILVKMSHMLRTGKIVQTKVKKDATKMTIGLVSKTKFLPYEEP